MECQIKLRSTHRPYPKTCDLCGLSGVCKYSDQDWYKTQIEKDKRQRDAKSEAQNLANDLGVSIAIARDTIAKKRGFKNWIFYLAHLVDQA